MTKWTLALTAVSSMACARTPLHSPSPDAVEVEAERPPRMPLATEVTGWRQLWSKLDEHDRDIDLRPLPKDDQEAREWMCSSGEGEPYCEGRAPWVVELRNDSEWIFHVITVGPEGLLYSEPFGYGGLARCGADTEARLEWDHGALRVVVTDYFQFPFEECECDSQDEDDCECMTGCGDAFEAKCSFSVDPESLALGEPDTTCSGLDVGEAAGYEI